MRLRNWLPAILLGVGWLLSIGVRPQLTTDLRMPLAEAIPIAIAGDEATERRMSESERVVAAPTDYVLRTYGDEPGPNGGGYKYSIYVGYYASQTRGKTIHSPRNCLPGGGWEALANSSATIQTERGPVRINRHLVHRQGQSALVVYWYQGRGRVESNEYLVKWNLLRDAALRRRSEEALVRVMVPVKGSEETAFHTAATVAAELVAAMNTALPT